MLSWCAMVRRGAARRRDAMQRDDVARCCAILIRKCFDKVLGQMRCREIIMNFVSVGPEKSKSSPQQTLLSSKQMRKEELRKVLKMITGYKRVIFECISIFERFS
jgi:hypothetical protein